MRPTPCRPRWSVLARLMVAVVPMLAALMVGSAGPAQAVTTCSNVWYTIEVGNSPGYYFRPSSNYQRAGVFANGTAASPWNNYFQLCRDPGWVAGDYALRANLGGYYLQVNPDTGDLIMADTSIRNTTNLLRIFNFDGNFQTLWSPSMSRYVGPYWAWPHEPNAWISDRYLGGSNLYKVRSVTSPPQIPSIPWCSNGICH